MKISGLSLLAASVLLLGPMGRPGAQGQPARPTAEQNFLWYCIQCHGPRGDGKGVNNTAKLPVSPRNLTDGRDMAQFSDADMTRTISRGGGASDLSPIMPPWGNTLSAEDIRDLVAHVRKLCQCQFDPKAKERFLREQGKMPAQSQALDPMKETSR
ncbi:MAG: cytochrome c [Candidatus Tectomicrobia bacterium]|nr:cytochrome c [Candidatus Tectomicrobia bacterium]